MLKMDSGTYLKLYWRLGVGSKHTLINLRDKIELGYLCSHISSYLSN